MTTTTPSATTCGSFTPVGGNERIESIDVVRGLALLGILVVNSLFFAFPLADAMGAPVPASEADPTRTWDLVGFVVVVVLFQYKFMSLFSLLFGVGAAIQFQRASAAGRRFESFFIVRCRRL